MLNNETRLKIMHFCRPDITFASVLYLGQTLTLIFSPVKMESFVFKLCGRCEPATMSTPFSSLLSPTPRSQRLKVAFALLSFRILMKVGACVWAVVAFLFTLLKLCLYMQIYGCRMQISYVFVCLYRSTFSLFPLYLWGSLVQCFKGKKYIDLVL